MLTVTVEPDAVLALISDREDEVVIDPWKLPPVPRGATVGPEPVARPDEAGPGANVLFLGGVGFGAIRRPEILCGLGALVGSRSVSPLRHQA